jgi:hypothetical protein
MLFDTHVDRSERDLIVSRHEGARHIGDLFTMTITNRTWQKWRLRKRIT